jgi:hypothetical protein
MTKKFIALALLGVTAGISLQAEGEVAWQKKPLDECRKGDAGTFENSLSPYAMGKYRTFNADQKKKAMDYADNNKMSPDDAVERVSAEVRR